MAYSKLSTILCLTALSLLSCKPQSNAPVAQKEEKASTPPTEQKKQDPAASKQLFTAPKAPEGMTFIPGGSYMRGSHGKQDNGQIYPEEAPVHKTTVSPFFMDITEVTNAQFKAFVDATGFKTFAERGLSKQDFPAAPAEMLKPGAGVFKPTPQAIDPFRSNPTTWWPFVVGASWKHPQGPGSSIEKIMDHPVVCINHDDAEAYATWAGKRLPTEAEWEFAARGGLKEKKYAWGDQRYLGQWMGNFYQGTFPSKNTKEDGYEHTAPVKSFPANNYGLYDVSGNVWEMCSDFYRPTYYREFLGKEAINPTGPTNPVTSNEVAQWRHYKRLPEPPPETHALMFLRAVKGGSFLCHVDYCLRYRPAARHQAESLTPTNHTGFRCVQDLKK